MAKTGEVKGRKTKGLVPRPARSRVKQAAAIGLWSVGLTLILYLLSYYFLPPPTPSAPLVSLFAFLAVIIVHFVLGSVRGRSSARDE